MPWSPPRKGTLTLSFILEVLGLIVGLAAYGLVQLEALNIDPDYVIYGLYLCFAGWVLLVLGIRFRGI